MSLPTQLTVLRIVLVPVFFILFAIITPAQVGWAALVFGIASASDWWDGYMARTLNVATPLGAFLDPLADKLLTSAAFVAFAVKGYIGWWMVLVVIARDLYLTLFRTVADNIELPIKTSYFAKVKTFIQMTFICYLLAALVAAQGQFGAGLIPAGVEASNPALLSWLMNIIVSLTVISALQYSYDNWGALSQVVRRYVLRRSPQKL